MWLVLIVIAAFIIYPKVIADPPKDDSNKKPLRAENLMGTQYTEILPVWGNAITKKLTAGVYNTLTLNNPDECWKYKP